jgi:malonyl-CoA decarboxylase
VAEVERVNARLEEAALTTARALGEVSHHWDAVYDAMRRDRVEDEIASERDHDAAKAPAARHRTSKQVVEDLGRELPRVHTFATLSPVPGFAAWLAATPELPDRRRSPALDALLAAVRGDISTAPAHLEAVRSELMAWGAHYLLHAKRGDGAPHDSAARFHLANGARLERLNWKGDLSEPGLRRSLGLTVNYVYRLEDVERNHEAYATQHRVTSAARFARLAT